MSRWTPWIIAVVALPLAAAGAGVVWLAMAAAKLETSFDARQVEYVGSEACRDCHADRHRSWSQTFHRTMTQAATPDSVQGRFDNRALEFQGIVVRPIEHEGRFYFDYSDASTGRHINRSRIYRTVGSNRYQQYLTRLDDDETYVRLHYLWHNEDQRWVHMNAAFLGADNRSFDQHVAIWNQNCIFCHNTGVQPGLLNADDLRARARAGEPVDMAKDTRFDSEVAELGISCETCHGPGAEHVRRADDFWQRQAMRLLPGHDTSIVNPVRDPVRGTQVCGQCHAQRVPADAGRILDWMTDGPDYRPGEDLHEYVTPIRRGLIAPIRGSEDMFRNRFWADGTPRLTAYEYQGMRMSEGHRDTDLSCMDCHTMHAGDPRGQMTERQRGDAPCLRCHVDYAGDEQLVAHTRHPADSPGSRCYGCHMPQAVYGVMDIHRSHRIESPDAVRDAAAGRPNACLNCHLGQAPGWAADQLTRHWNVPGGPIERLDGADPALAEGATVLFGDPVQKAVIAFRAGQPDHDGGRLETAWRVPWLLAAMEDNYPSTRRFAHHSLSALFERWPAPGEIAPAARALAEFDFTAPPAVRAAVLAQVRTHWQALDKHDWPAPPAASGLAADYRLPAALRLKLERLGQRQDKQIDIGE